VFVQLEDAPARPPLPKAEPVPVDQRDWVFVPRVVAVQHGRPVRFDNNDSVNHSVQAMSLKQPANEFNRTAGPGTPIVHTFAPQEGPVIIGCGLHAWMRAYVYVVPHPWFAVTDAEGKFRLAEVPPGKYVLLATHPDTGLKERRAVTVAAGQTTEVAVTWTKVR
jgi:plastocyanin